MVSRRSQGLSPPVVLLSTQPSQMFFPLLCLLLTFYSSLFFCFFRLAYSPILFPSFFNFLSSLLCLLLTFYSSLFFRFRLPFYYLILFPSFFSSFSASSSLSFSVSFPHHQSLFIQMFGCHNFLVSPCFRQHLFFNLSFLFFYWFLGFLCLFLFLLPVSFSACFIFVFLNMRVVN